MQTYKRNKNLRCCCRKRLSCEIAAKNARGGYLDISAVDLVLPSQRVEGIHYQEATLTKLPFANHSFDTVICTHALEHIKDCHCALEELRRVCRKRLIIVLPKQREYQYTFDLHIHFFPYKYNVQKFLNNEKARIFEVDHDWICVEDVLQ